VKDINKMRKFIDAVRSAEEEAKKWWN
jgi:hypothetical protein